MELELDHVFVMVDPAGKVANSLVDLGMEESFSRDHPGQGTSNRRFELSNSMIEFLWVRDADEAENGPGQKMRFVDRFEHRDSSPFGVILRSKDDTDSNMPFEGWTYQPDYFEAPMAFHIGNNSSNLLEPLCIYAPFLKPCKSSDESAGESSPDGSVERSISNDPDEGIFKSLTSIRITTTMNPLSGVMGIVNNANRLSVISGKEHLMEITLDNNRQGLSKDFRPGIPVVINW